MITDHIAENYLDCKRKAYLALAGQIGVLHDYQKSVNELREQYRPKALAALLQHCRVDAAPTLASVATRDLKLGYPVIADCTVENVEHQFHFDALCRTEGDSTLGHFHYLPVAFIHGDQVRDEHKLLLTAQAAILARIQKCNPATGFCIVGPLCRIVKVPLASRWQKALTLLEDLTQLTVATTPPTLRLVRHCDVCGFKERCAAEAKEKERLEPVAKHFGR